MLRRKIFRQLLSIDAAKEMLYSNFEPKPVGVENVSLKSACGKVLSENVEAFLDVPPFDRASMDGYAVKAEDTFKAGEASPVKLTIVGRIKAGARSDIEISSGQAVEIATGAPIPLGANAVVMVEHTISENGWVKIFKPASPYENIMPAGSDISIGETILRKGVTLTPREIGILASFGAAEVHCYKKPKVAIFSTGDEIISPSEPLENGKIYDINSYTLCCAVNECGCEPLFLGVIKDYVSDLTSKLRKGLETADLVIVSGGTSAGVGDLLYNVIDKLGEPGILVHGISIKPGKPTIIGLNKGKLIFGLPGYPTSALIIFDIFVKPVLMKMAGLEPVENIQVVNASMGEKVFSSEGRKEFTLVNLVEKNDGTYLAFPITKGSGAITTLAQADGYIEIPENKVILEKNEKLEIKLFSSKTKLANLMIGGENCPGVNILLDLFCERNHQYHVKFLQMNLPGVLSALRREEIDLGVVISSIPRGEGYRRVLSKYGLEKKVTIVKGYHKSFGWIIKKKNLKHIRNLKDALRRNIVVKDSNSFEKEIFNSYLAKLSSDSDTELEFPTRINKRLIKVKSNAAMITALLNSEADMAFSSEQIAVAFNLDFIPLLKQSYDFAFRRTSLQKTSTMRLLEIIKSEQFKSKIIASKGLFADERLGEILHSH